MNQSTTTSDRLLLTSEQRYQLRYVVYFWIQGVAYSIICSIGVLANLLNIITLWRQRKLVTYKIFLGMAIADLVVVSVMLSYSLCFAIHRPLVTSGTIGQPPNLTAPYSEYVWLHTWYHIQNTFMCASNWCVVLVAVFRLIAIVFPLKATVYAHPTAVNIAISLVYVCSVLVQIPGYLTSKWENGVHRSVPEMTKYSLALPICNSLLPVFTCCIVTVTLLITLKVKQMKMRGSIKSCHPCTKGMGEKARWQLPIFVSCLLIGLTGFTSLFREQVENRKKEHRQLTITQILILIFFLITNMPDVIYWLMRASGAFQKYHITQYSDNVFYLTATIFTALNYSCNFFIYILSNASFRQDLKFTLRRCRHCLTWGQDRKMSTASRGTGISSVSSDNRQHQQERMSELSTKTTGGTDATTSGSRSGALRTECF